MIKDKFDLARFGKISHKIRSVELRKKRAPRFVSASLDISKSNFSDFFCRNCFREIFHTFTNLMMFSTNYTAVIRFHLTSEFWAKLETQHSENVV